MTEQHNQFSASDPGAMGRAQALEIILKLCPEDQLSDCTRGVECGATGDYEVLWDKDRLCKLLHLDGEVLASPLARMVEMAEAEYWEWTGKKEEFAFLEDALRKLIDQIDQGQIQKSGYSPLWILKTRLGIDQPNNPTPAG